MNSEHHRHADLPVRANIEAHTVRITRRMLRILASLLSGIMLLAMLMVLIIAHRQNLAATEQDEVLLRQAWQSEQQDMLTSLRDYASWSEAWKNLHLTVNKVWAWDEENFGAKLYQEYHYDGVFVVDSQGRTRYAVVHGTLSRASLESWFGAQAAPLLAAARQRSQQGVMRNALIHQQPAMVAAVPISPGKVPNLPGSNDPSSIMVFVNVFNPQKLQALGQSLNILALRRAMSLHDALNTPRITEGTLQGDALVLRWQAKQPGLGLIWILMPLLLLTALVMALVARRMMRQAIHSAVISDRRFDMLTGLANRVQLEEFLTTYLQTADEERPLYVINIDLDQFKPINDTWGHTIGDVVLSQISLRLKSLIGPDELAARLGGDAFILVLRVSSRAQIEYRCGMLQHAIHQPIISGSHRFSLTASMGIVCAPQDATDVETLLRLADMALGEARVAGRDCWVWYSDGMASHLHAKHEKVQAMEQALAQQAFTLHYQPRYQLESGELVGAEALIRWQVAEDQWIPPDCFIPLAEEQGLITAISDWVLMRACLDACSWGTQRYVSVNISPVEFRHSDLVQRVAHALEVSGLAASQLELEITENVTFEHPDRALVIMQGLRALGVRLTVDDFGTGYAALGYLKTFPFSGVKIDRSWIKEFPESQQAQSVVAGIIGLARAFALTITAEGIETEAQLNALKALSCEEGQGYFLGRPMPHATFSAQLNEQLSSDCGLSERALQQSSSESQSR